MVTSKWERGLCIGILVVGSGVVISGTYQVARRPQRLPSVCSVDTLVFSLLICMFMRIP